MERQNHAPITPSLEHEDSVLDAVFSSDGLRVATASKDNTARIWDANTGQPIGLPLRHLRTVVSVAFSPDNFRLVTASLDHTARIWDTATGKPVTPPLEHNDSLSFACFSPSGHRVVTASADRTARIWDARTGLPLSEPLRHTRPVKIARFDPKDGRVVTGAFAPDNPGLIWDAPVAPSRIPDWLPTLAEAIAGLMLESEKGTRPISETEFEQIKQHLEQLPPNDDLSRLVRWFFADRGSRAISPFHSETLSEFVQRRIEKNTRASLEEAVRLQPTNSLALRRLAKAVAETHSSVATQADAANLQRLASRFGNPAN